MKPVLISALLLASLNGAFAQVGEGNILKTPTPGKNNLYILKRQPVSLSGLQIKHSLANNTAGINGNSERINSLPITYVFTGNGNWDDATNWLNNTIPPATLPGGSEIDINPAPGGECILNVPVNIAPLGIFMVFSNASLRILSDLNLF